MEERLIRECVERWKKACENYYLTVNAVLALRHYLNKHNLGCRFVSAERTMRTREGGEHRPDILLQYNKDRCGIIGELKTSIMVGPIPNVEEDRKIREALEQVKRSDTELEGWDTPDGRVDTHDLTLICYQELTSDILPKIKDLLQKGEFQFERPFAVWTWVMSESRRTGYGEFIHFQQVYGKTRCAALSDALSPGRGIKVYTNEFPSEYEQMKFIKSEPPVFYTMEILFQHIFPLFDQDEERYIEVELGTLIEQVTRYFASWANIPGAQSQINPRWVRKAVERFVKIGMGEDLGSGKYRIKAGLRVLGNLREYLIHKFCKSQIEARRAGSMETLERWLAPPE